MHSGTINIRTPSWNPLESKQLYINEQLAQSNHPQLYPLYTPLPHPNKILKTLDICNIDLIISTRGMNCL